MLQIQLKFNLNFFNLFYIRLCVITSDLDKSRSTKKVISRIKNRLKPTQNQKCVTFIMNHFDTNKSNF